MIFINNEKECVYVQIPIYIRVFYVILDPLDEINCINES